MRSVTQALAGADLPESASAKLDAELLLCKVLSKPRSFLRTWPEHLLSTEQERAFNQLLERRRQGEPVAYLLGEQGFWNLQLAVNDQTLIPRPDTELLVETALALELASPCRVLDLGTGSGAIALALACERPTWQVLGVDRIEAAVELAERNRQMLHLDNAAFLHSHWFSNLSGGRFAVIVSNPPYIAANDPHLSRGDLRFEPASALVSGVDGLDDLRQIIAQAPGFLEPGGWLLLEHGFDQAQMVRALLSQADFVGVHSRRDLAGHERISLGQKG